LLHGRIPSIGFMRPFDCPVIILNTLDHLGKFQGKVDEGFLVGYSMCSKAFRVISSRTRIVQETLYVDFLKNKPNVAGAGPTWLFDIDSLLGTMNYHPVSVANHTNASAGFQDSFDAQKAREEVTQTYVLFLAWSAGSTNPQDNDKDALVDGKEHGVDIQKSVTADIHFSSRYRDLNAEFEECSNNNSNRVNASRSLVPTAGHNFINSTNNFSVVGPSNTAVSPTYENYSFQDASASSHDPDMPTLEDFTYSDNEAAVGAEADINNLESSILISPIPTTKIHKDHPISQIIGDLSSTTQTRSMEEGNDYEEVFAPVARIKAIRLFLAFASFMGFLVYQMDVKIAFVYGTIEKEVYVCQPPGFEDLDHHGKVYKVVKALYGLHQAPRAWYETLATYLLKNGFQRGTIDKTLFIKKKKWDILLVEIYQIDLDHPLKVLSMQEDDSEVQEAVEVVTTAKLITEVVNAASTLVSGASTIIPTAKQIIPVTEPNIPTVTIIATPVKVAAASTRRRKRVVIRDPEEESSATTSNETKSKDKGKGILVEEPKPMKKKQQVEMDEAYARKLHEELNQDIDCDVAIKRTEAQARRNMIMYLKNTAGFKLDYFKGKSYDDIRPIFEARFNTNMEFLLKSMEQIEEEEESRALESINETPA
nr:putative ribonuclease H-like domain-containing protein [Tanacetum cinerariifolium]